MTRFNVGVGNQMDLESTAQKTPLLGYRVQAVMHDANNDGGRVAMFLEHVALFADKSKAQALADKVNAHLAGGGKIDPNHWLGTWFSSKPMPSWVTQFRVAKLEMIPRK